jgi:hypothetical protein
VTSEKGQWPRVKVSDPEGQLMAMIGTEHFLPASAGLDLAVDGIGRIFVADPARDMVLVFERDGEGG